MSYKSFELVSRITKELEKLDLYDYNTTEKLKGFIEF